MILLRSESSSSSSSGMSTCFDCPLRSFSVGAPPTAVELRNRVVGRIVPSHSGASGTSSDPQA